MTEQWGRWFADPPRAAEPTTETAVEPVAEDQSFVTEESDVVDEPVAVAEDEPDVAAEPVVGFAPEPELTDDTAADDSDPAVSSVYALRQRLGELEELPIAEHPARYEQLHAELTVALGRIDGGA